MHRWPLWHLLTVLCAVTVMELMGELCARILEDYKTEGITDFAYFINKESGTLEIFFMGKRTALLLLLE